MKKFFLLLILSLIIAFPVSASLWDFYQERGEPLPSVEERYPAAANCGIVDYSGEFYQNIDLEACLRGIDTWIDPDFENDRLLGLMPDKLQKVLRESIAAGTNNANIDVSPLVTLQGRRLVMTDIGDRLFVRLGSGDNVTWGYCTGLTDNTSYYTMTGCELGLYDYGDSLNTLTTNILSHSSGEPVVVTNQHHWYLNYFPNKTASSTILCRSSVGK